VRKREGTNIQIVPFSMFFKNLLIIYPEAHISLSNGLGVLAGWVFLQSLLRGQMSPFGINKYKIITVGPTKHCGLEL